MRKKRELQPEFYQALEHALDNFSHHELFYLEYIALNIYEWLYNKLPEQPAILDIGSGYGLLTRLVQILFNVSNVYGIDVERETLTYAQEIYPSIMFKQCHTSEIPHDDNMFDLVYAHTVFHHVATQNHAQYCAEINRVLKPDGMALIIELNPYNIFTRTLFKRDPHEQSLEMLSPSYMKKLLKPYGKINTRYFGFFQQWFIKLRFLEPYISKIPFGSLYAITLKTTKK